MDDREERACPAAGLRIERRAEGDDRQQTIVGHAAVFDQLSQDRGGWRERIAPGAFSRALAGDVRALFNHDPNIVLGRTAARTLRLAEDREGLLAEIDPPDSPAAATVLEAIRRGDVTGMSIGFRTVADRWERDDEHGEIRTLLDVELFDISPVTFPAYTQTDVALRSLEAWRRGSDAGHRPGDGRIDGAARRNLTQARTRFASIT